VVAGKLERSIFDLLGVKDVLCKRHGRSRSIHAVLHSMFYCLKKAEDVGKICSRRNISKEYLLTLYGAKNEAR
jgi:ribosomal protein S5